MNDPLQLMTVFSFPLGGLLFDSIFKHKRENLMPLSRDLSERNVLIT